MSKFYKHINEWQEERDISTVKTLDTQKAYDMIQKKCGNAIKAFNNGIYILRSTRTANNMDIGFSDSTKLPARMSRNTLNYYTHIINDDSTWSGYPRRQVIATGFTGGFQSFGIKSNFTVFPFDNVVIGECLHSDIWFSFPRLIQLGRMEAQEFNEFIHWLLNKPGGGAGVRPFDNSLKEFRTACRRFDSWITNMKSEEGPSFDESEAWDLLASTAASQLTSSEEVYRKFFDFYKGSLYGSILYFYSPDAFKKFKIGKPFKKNSEIWFDGPAIYVNETITLAFVDGVF